MPMVQRHSSLNHFLVPEGRGGEGDNVAHVEGSLLSADDELSSVHTLGCNHELLVELVLAGIVEVYASKGGATTRVMNDLLNNALDETVLLGEVDVTELCSSLAKTGVGCEDRPTSLTLGSNDTTHGLCLRSPC